MAEQYKVIISQRAASMMTSHAAFLARVSVPAAERLASEFTQVARSLEMMPLRNPWFNQEYLPQNCYRSLLFGARYAILYQVKDDTVYIDYVLDCRQDYSFLL